ncbi:MAG: dicarboxylate/amino acid:cation symporter [Mollicutes bacterium]|nr:dicarboxylate/amino acid:cation symporter [Mollicutes bacterium]
MKLLWKNYKQTILLLLSLVIGTIIGIVAKEKAVILSPFGDLFMNMMFVIIVPLIFLTITTSIAKIKKPKRLSKVIITTFAVFLVTSLIACLVGLISTYSVRLVNTKDSTKIMKNVKTNVSHEKENMNILKRTVEAISVNDFPNLLSKNSIIALVLISILTGLAINKIGKDAEDLIKVLESANKVVLKLVDIIFYYAPIGLGCYFAALVGNFGSEIATGYFKTFIYYTVIALLFYFIIYSLYAYIAAGKKGVISFWKNIMPATVTSVSTCSSAASIPANLKTAKGIGVPSDIAETVIPLGTNFHKDGTVIGSVFKVMFLVYLFNVNVASFSSIFKIIGVSLIANLLVTAVPVGGGTISEMVILIMMGFPVNTLPILTIIATIIDPPATLLNVVGDSAASMLITRIVDGKNWLKIKKKK